jgi:hypothetical protein
MIYFDAVYVNSLGAIKILKLIINDIKIRERKLTILILDKRLKDDEEIDIKHFFKIEYINKGTINRIKTYFKYKNVVKKIFSLGNVPLPILNRPQITYNMQYFLFDRSFIYNDITRFIWLLKSLLINVFFKISNSSVAVQTNTMRDLFENKFKIDNRKIMLFPVFKEFESISFENNKNIRFLCISSGEKYKKIEELIANFERLCDKNLDLEITLTLTIPDKYQELINIIQLSKDKGYNLNNSGYVDEFKIAKLLKQNYYVVHPSEVESFGLVLVEASSRGNAIIAPNKRYVYDVCEPSIVYDQGKMFEALDSAIKNKVYPSKLCIRNMSKELVKELYQ